MVVVSDTGYLVLIGSKVNTCIVAKVLTNSVVPRESELNTGILHVTTIDGSRVSTVDSNLRTCNQPVLRCLLIPVEVDTQTVIEETGVETKVELLRSLPSEICIRYDVSLCTGMRSTSRRSIHVRTELVTIVASVA